MAKSKKIDANDLFAGMGKQNKVIFQFEGETNNINNVSDNEEVIADKINYANADEFIPYSDERLRLDLHTGEEREQLKESIQKTGIINPVICMQADNGLEIISGHNRVDICKELSIKVPYILKKNLSREEADLICIDTNLLNRQRADYKPSQFAYILKVKFDSEKYQRNNSDKYTGDQIGEEYGLKRRQIHTYIKLNDLVDSAKKITDEGKITIAAAYELAYLPQDIQMILVNLSDDYKITDKSLKSIRSNIADKEFSNNQDKIDFLKGMLTTRHIKQRKFDFRNISKYIPEDIKESDIESYIIEAIKAYRGY